MTPYDVAIARVADGEPLVGMPPDDLDRYLAVYRAHPHIGCVIARGDAALVSAAGLRACALRVLEDRGGGSDERVVDERWRTLVAEARGAGALIGAFPLGEE